MQILKLELGKNVYFYMKKLDKKVEFIYNDFYMKMGEITLPVIDFHVKMRRKKCVFYVKTTLSVVKISTKNRLHIITAIFT